MSNILQVAKNFESNLSNA